MSLTTDKTKSNFHCANLPKARKFYFFLKILFVQAYVDFFF